MSGSDVRIEVTEGGPFIVSGGPSMRDAEYVFSEKGEPMTWSFGSAEVLGDEAALCRCGQSSNLPFCDGTHDESPWDSETQVPTGTYASRAKEKVGTGLTVTDDATLCMHAGLCGSEKQTVWSLISQTDDTDKRATVIRMVEKCPSGRLVNVIDGRVNEPSLAKEIGVIPGGPLWVTGSVPVSLPDGGELETRNRVTLCRCGASDMKPLCDGSHSKIDFDGVAAEE